jgi:hypothetical protein
MLEGLTEEEADTFLQENPTIVPLYEIDVVQEAEPYQLLRDKLNVGRIGWASRWIGWASRGTNQCELI